MPTQPPPEGDRKAAENEAPEDKVTRGNFEALARGLFRVSPSELSRIEKKRANSERD